MGNQTYAMRYLGKLSCNHILSNYILEIDDIIIYLSQQRLFGRRTKAFPPCHTLLVTIPHSSSPSIVVALINRAFVQQLFHCHLTASFQAEQHTTENRKVQRKSDHL